MKKVWIAKQTEGVQACTAAIQQLIDECSAAGGGQVRLMAGNYPIATLYLKSNVELYLDAGAVLVGSSDYQDYSNQIENPVIFKHLPRWYDAMITAVGQTNVSVAGEGIIDGVGCLNEFGEQQFRGPHSIFMCNCTDVRITGVTIVRSACYSIMLEGCRDAQIRHVAVRGGQDGLRIALCKNIHVYGCDIRSGDDCIGGSSNEDVFVENTSLNTPGGSTVVFSCQRFYVRNCKLWTAGEYPALFTNDKRYSVSSVAFRVGTDYGYPNAEPSGDWVIENVTVENVEELFHFISLDNGNRNFPVKNVTMDHVHAENLVRPMFIRGDEGTPLQLTIRNSTLSFISEDPQYNGCAIDAEVFEKIELENVCLKNVSSVPIVCDGGDVALKDVTLVTPVSAQNVKADRVTVEHTPPATATSRYVKEQETSVYVSKETTEEFLGARTYVPNPCNSF